MPYTSPWLSQVLFDPTNKEGQTSHVFDRPSFRMEKRGSLYYKSDTIFSLVYIFSPIDLTVIKDMSYHL